MSINTAVKYTVANVVPLAKQTARYGIVFAAVLVTSEGAKNILNK